MADGSDELYQELRERTASISMADGVVRPTVRPLAVRPDGLEGAGMRFAEAGLASSTGPVFDADDLPEGVILSPAQAIKGLYAAFNARDAACVASFLTDDCVYEDLLLGPATVCRGKEAFLNALQYHPAFVSNRIFGRLPFAEYFPDLTLEVDSIAEGVDTVGVEWHVQCGDAAFPLGRGLSQARVCKRTGKIERVVDIAEAPWRVIGLVALPFISAVQYLTSAAAGEAETETTSAASSGSSSSSSSSSADNSGGGGGELEASEGERVMREYSIMLDAVLCDGIVDPSEREMLASYAAEHFVSGDQHAEMLRRAGWTAEEYESGAKQQVAE